MTAQETLEKRTIFLNRVMLFADYCKMMDDSPVEELIIRGLRNQKQRRLTECWAMTWILAPSCALNPVEEKYRAIFSPFRALGTWEKAPLV
jgi:hypothetical protein